MSQTITVFLVTELNKEIEKHLTDELLDKMIDSYIACEIGLDQNPKCSTFWKDVALPMVDLMLKPKKKILSKPIPTLYNLNAPGTIFGAKLSNEVILGNKLQL